MSYIKREDALKLAHDIVVPQKSGGEYRHRCIDPQEIIELPAADVVERKRGEWHDIYCIGKYEVDLMICSNCNGRTLISGVSLPNYCPNCGAKMEGNE